MVPVLILDKQLAMDRMVAEASRPCVPPAYRRGEPAIEALAVGAPAEGVPSRRLAGVVVLAGARIGSGDGAGIEPPLALEPGEQPADAPLESRPRPGPEWQPERTPGAEPHVSLIAVADDPQRRRGLLRRIARRLLPAPRARASAAHDRPYLPRDARRIYAWHARPLDMR
jgi:hypothetical protein